MKFFITLISFSVLLVSCSKDKTDMHTDKVQVRIENATGIILENAHVADVNYGDVAKHKVTDYKVLTELIYSGYCIFNVNGIQSWAGLGVCDSPLPPPFEPGFYTFKVMPAIDGYNPIKIIKK